MQVLLATGLIDAFHAALEDRERALDCVRADRAVFVIDVLADAVKALTADRAACRVEAANYDWSRCTQAFVAGLATRRVRAVSGALALA